MMDDFDFGQFHRGPMPLPMNQLKMRNEWFR